MTARLSREQSSDEVGRARCSFKAIAKEAMQRGWVGASTLCLGKTPGQDGLAALLLLVPCGRPWCRSGDDRIRAKALANRASGDTRAVDLGVGPRGRSRARAVLPRLAVPAR